MANKKAGERDVRKLTKSGIGSIGLTLPIEVVRELKWKEKQKVTAKKVRGGVLIKDWSRHSVAGGKK